MESIEELKAMERAVELAASDLLLVVELVGHPYWRGKDANIVYRENRNPWMGE